MLEIYFRPTKFMEELPILFYGDESDPDFLKATHFAPPDPMLCVCTANKSILVANDLELERARSQSCCEVIAESTLKNKKLAGRMVELLERCNVTGTVYVTPRFPCHLYQQLRNQLPDLTVEFLENGLSSRRTKTAEEIGFIELANLGSVQAFERVREILKASAVDPKTRELLFEGAVLTSEILKREIEVACIRANCVSLSTIAAGGSQSAQPHCSGFGPLHAGEFIICDIFPRHRSGYFGDMTRTFMKGKPTEEQRKMHAAVQKAHNLSVSMVAVGVDYKAVALAAEESLTGSGFPRETRNGVPVGMIHGLGHGVGLQIHEEPHVNTRAKQQVQAGDVFTIEPGVYYPEHGGVRIEDSFWVAPDGTVHRFQAACGYDWVVE